jgi:hypothetical protein
MAPSLRFSDAFAVLRHVSVACETAEQPPSGRLTFMFALAHWSRWLLSLPGEWHAPCSAAGFVHDVAFILPERARIVPLARQSGGVVNARNFAAKRPAFLTSPPWAAPHTPGLIPPSV